MPRSAVASAEAVTEKALVPPHSCGGCKARWWGIGIAHCGKCHLTFSAVSVFDEHRSGGRCLKPAALKKKGIAPLQQNRRGKAADRPEREEPTVVYGRPSSTQD